MAFGYASHGGIAGHLRDQIEVHRDHGSSQAHASARPRGLATGMSGTHHDDVVFRRLHDASIQVWHTH
jgi:hypothetical protein